MTINVLVLDRTCKIESMAKTVLTPLGCQIITASSTALGLFLARKNYPSLVIAGIKDPADYDDLPDALKDDPDLAHIPIIFIGKNGNTTPFGVAKSLGWPVDEKTFLSEIIGFLKESVDERPEETSE